MEEYKFCPICGFRYVYPLKNDRCIFCNCLLANLYTTSEEANVKQYFVTPEEISNIFEKVIKK